MTSIFSKWKTTSIFKSRNLSWGWLSSLKILVNVIHLTKEQTGCGYDDTDEVTADDAATGFDSDDNDEQQICRSL
jgi:hypothetical protein